MSDAEINQYGPSNIEQFQNWYPTQCVVVDDSRLYISADVNNVAGTNGWNVTPVDGSLYQYNGKYYLCVNPSGGWAPTNPENSFCWRDVTELFK